jgi:predicted amidophosphoribosyltransferase
MTNAFIDARCRKCGADIGWFGKMSDRPPCHKCGHQLSPEELKAGDNWWDNLRAKIEAKHQALMELCKTDGTPEREAYLAGQAERAAKPPRKMKAIVEGAEDREVAGAGVEFPHTKNKDLDEAWFNGYWDRQ